MSIAESQDVPAAWYPDRIHPGQLRWWDGRDWTDQVRPHVVAAPEPVEIVDSTPAFQAPPLLQSHRGVNVVAQPAQGFGHASPQQLRAWPAPRLEDRNQIPTPVSSIPTDWRHNPPRAEPVKAVSPQSDDFITLHRDLEPDLEHTLVLVPNPPLERTLELPTDDELPPRFEFPKDPEFDFIRDNARQAPAAPQMAALQPAVPPAVAALQPDQLAALTRRQLRAIIGPLTTESAN